MPVVRCRSRAQQACASIALVLALLAVAFPPARALQFDGGQVRQLARKQYGARGEQAVSAWLDMLSGQAAAPESAQLRAVNDFWNRTVRGGEDRDIWRQADYWATPLESLGKRAGDCEDFVIGKYFSLVHLGVPPDKLRLIYVRARVGGMGSSASIAHMVLGYYPTPDADPMVLDNLMGSIVPASQRPDLKPVFSFNADGIYVAGAAPASVERISRWQGLLSRMRQEGFRP